jgi:hypothetical protein
MLTRGNLLGREREAVLLSLERHALLAQVCLQLLVADHDVPPYFCLTSRINAGCVLREQRE